MATGNQLPNFTLEVHGDMQANWEYFEETFESYVTLMGYRQENAKQPDKELAALMYALPKEARLVLKNSIIWTDTEDKTSPSLHLQKLKAYYAGTKSLIHERVQFNQMVRMEAEPISNWESRCRKQGFKCEYCATCSPQIIRDRFIVGINDDNLLSKLVNSAVKDSAVSLETTVLTAKQYEATKNCLQAMTVASPVEEQKKALAALRAPKPEPKEQKEPAKRPLEHAADATAQAKKLLLSGAIKVGSEKKEQQTFKRSKRQKESEKVPVGFQPFSPTNPSEQDEENKQEPSKGKSMKGLYESFVGGDGERSGERRMSEREDRKEAAPKRGNTIYVFGRGVTEEILNKAFSNFGAIINISFDSKKHCGFVTYEKMDSADQAIAEMNGSMFSDVQLKVSIARRQPTFEKDIDPSTASWASIAASKSQKGSHKDSRDLVTYDDDDIF